ncbi:hypothetical protein ABPG72_013661 [Tetrahymena utriculariae]
MFEGGKFPTCSKHSSKRILKICFDLDCQEILLCQQCEQQKKHSQSVDILQFSTLESEQIQSGIERLQNMRKKIIQLNEKVSNQKNNANLIVEECFASVQKSFLSYLDNCQQNVLNGVSLFSEKFRKIFSKLLQEISDDTYNIKKHINRLNESPNNQTFDNYTITQGIKSVQYNIIHKIPHLEKICEDLQEKQQLNLINTDSIRNNVENIQIDLQQIFSKLSLNAFPAKMDNLSLEYELQPPKVNFNSIYDDTITQVQLEQSIFAHLNPISSLISVSQFQENIIKQQNSSIQNPSSLDDIEQVQLISTGWDGTIKAWNLQKSQPIIELNTYNGGISAAAFQECQNLLICSHFNYSLEIYQLDFNIDKEDGYYADITKSALLSDDKQGYEKEMSKSVNLSQVLDSSSVSPNKNKVNKKYQKLGKIDPHEKNIQSIIIKGNHILCGCSTSNIINVPIEKFNNEDIDKLIGHTSSVQVLCDFKSPNDQYFLSGSTDSLIFLWDLRKHKPTNMIQNSNEIINSISQLSEYTFLTGSHDSYIKIWDVRMFKNLKTIFGHRDAVSKTASFYSKLYNKSNQISKKSQLSNIFVSSGNDNIVNIWNVFDQQSLRFSMKGHSDVVWAMDIDVVNKKIYTGSRNEEIKIWSYT